MAHSLNTVFSPRSSAARHTPTNGRFEERLDAALRATGIDNATFAASLGVRGQQLVHNWRARGRIGRDSLAAVRAILPGISLDWINDGAGEMHQSAPLDPDSVADAYVSLSARFERAGLNYSPALDPDLFVAALEYAEHPEPARKDELRHLVDARIAQRAHGGAIIRGTVRR